MPRLDARADLRFDERDTMFARAARKPGTPEHEEYYSRHPELRRRDDRIRDLPALGEHGGRHYDDDTSPEAMSLFREIEAIEPDADLVESWQRALAGGEAQTPVLEEMARSLGAAAAGCAPAEAPYVYSHKGRLDEDYGRPVEADLPWAMVFLVEMDFDRMQRAPRGPALLESATQYFRAAVIAKTMAAAIEAAGGRARAHYDAHYELILPPLAVAAGLGELGRNNFLVADRYGARVRIGAVTTDLPLEPGRPRSLGVHDFCERCKKCADNCPSGALSKGEPITVRGVTKWPTNVEKCYSHWLRLGTDCGICMAVCPFSHRDNWFHATLRRVVRTHPLLARAALLGDDLIYGRKWKPSPR